MIIRCTSKFAGKIHVTLEQEDTGTDEGLTWYANVFTFDRRQYLLFSESTTLVSILLPGRGITTPEACFETFHREILLYFDYRGWGLVTRRFIQSDGKKVSFRKTTNRRVLGSMIDLKWQAQWTMEQRSSSMIEVNDEMNRNPMSYLKMDSPEERIKKLLNSI